MERHVFRPDQPGEPEEAARTPISRSPNLEQPLSPGTSEHGEINWNRLHDLERRFGGMIANGVFRAMRDQRDIELGTARCIAMVLGRGFGRGSALNEYAMAGEGDYTRMRDEYLLVYSHEHTSAELKELIDWLGSRVIHESFPGARTIDDQALFPPKIDHILVPVDVQAGDFQATVQVPGTYGTDNISELTETLTQFRLNEDPQLRAFLMLPDVNAASKNVLEDFSANLVGSFTSIEEALSMVGEVEERERDVTNYAAELRLWIEGFTPNYEALMEDARDGFDFVEHDGMVHVFTK